MTVSVREATEADLEAIRAVAEDAWYAALGGALDPATIEAALSEYYDPDLVAAGVEADAIAFHVASVDGAVRGFASAERTWADEVELHTIYVHPDRWGEGVGAALLDRIEAWAGGEGVDRIACGVLADNAVGIGFLEAAGFERGRATDVEVAGAVCEEYEYELTL